MAKLGDLVIFAVPKEHDTTTRKFINGAWVETVGSIYHRAQATFAGIIGGVNEDGTVSIALFVPNNAPKWVDNVREGNGAGTFKVLADQPKKWQ